MPRHVESGHDSLNISFSTGSNQSEDDPPKHPGYVTLLPSDLADHSTWDRTMSEAVLPSLSNVADHPKVNKTHATGYSKLKPAEEMVMLLRSKLGEGEAGRWEGVWSQSSTIACVACPATYEHQKRRHRTHTVHTATLNGWHPLKPLADIATTLGLSLTVSTTVLNKNCPMYKKLSLINNQSVSPISQKMLWYGMDASDVIASEKTGDHTSVPSHVQVRHHDGVARRVKAWGDYSILKDVEVVQQYIARCKAEDAAS